MHNRPSDRARCHRRALVASASIAEALEPRRLMAAGSLDSSFNKGQPLSIGGSQPIAMQTLGTEPLGDGRTLVVGTANNGANASALIFERLNIDGSADLTYGPGGQRAFNLSYQPLITFDAQRRIVVVTAGNLVYRFTAEGAPDPTFTHNGSRIIHDASNTQLRFSSIVVSPSGAIYIGGFGGIVCLRANGQLSPRFGYFGVGDVSAFDYYVSALAVQPDGKLLVAGGHANELRLARYDAQGIFDPTFANEGLARVTDDSRQISSTFNSISVAPGGEIYALGAAVDPEILAANRPIVVAAFHGDGSLDTRFGDGGTVHDVIGRADSRALPGVVVAGDDGVIVTGSVVGSRHAAAFVQRLGRRGNADTSYGAGGLQVIPTVDRGVKTSVADVETTPGNGLLISLNEYSDSLGPTVAPGLARLTSDGSLDTTFAGHGFFSTTVPLGIPTVVVDVAANASGVYVMTHGENQTRTITRYTTNGSIDRTYGHRGRFTIPSPLTSAVLGDGAVLTFEATGATQSLSLYSPDGTLDPSLGTGGRLSIPAFAPLNGTASARLLPRANGNVIVAITRENQTPNFQPFPRASRLYLVNPQGQILASQSGPDETIHPYSPSGDVTLTPDDGVALLTATQGIYRYNADLTFDTSFAVPPSYNLLAQPDGGLLLIHVSPVTITRIKSDGSPDPAFADAGILELDYPSAFLVQPDGNLITATLQTTGVLLRRYTATGVPDPAFGRHGHALLRIDGIETYQTLHLTLSAAGDHLIVGVDRNHFAAETPLASTEAIVAQIDI